MLLWKDLQFNLHVVLYYNGRELRHVLTLCCEYQIRNVPYCDRASSSLLKSQRGFPQSHSRAFVDAFLSSHLGFTYFVRNIVSFSGCSPLCSQNTHILGLLEYQTEVLCQTERLESQWGWCFLAGIFQVNEILKITWLYWKVWRRIHNFGYSCMLNV